jgi:hypothetical protein
VVKASLIEEGTLEQLQEGGEEVSDVKVWEEDSG